MKRLTGKKSFWRVAANMTLAAIVLSSALFVGVAPTFAAGDDAPPPQEGTDERIASRLEFAYLQLQHAAEGQALKLDHARDVADFLRDRIETLAESGEDVAELEAALEAAEAAIAESQGYYDEAKAVLDEHAGFDDDGKLTDREQAVETLREAGRTLRDARRALKDGAIKLRRAISDWRRQRRSQRTES